MRHKRIAACTAAALCIGMLTFPASAASEDFPAWASQAAKRWEDCGKLDQSMSPEHVMTRGEVAAAIDRVMTYTQEAENRFTDIRAEDAHSGALLRLVDAGVLQGNGTGQLLPDAAVTRQETAVMLARAFHLSAGGQTDYTDAAEIAGWAEGAVSAVTQAGVMQGSQGLFRPASTVTYAEMVQSLTAAVEEEGLITGLIVRTRDAEGVLAEGAARQVNDGKFRVETVTASEEGYTVALSGLGALTGQEADADGPGQPREAGKWMGVQLQLGGLVRVETLTYSRDGETWFQAKSSDALSEAHRLDSLMVYVNGAETADIDANEVEKTSTLYLRQGEEGPAVKITFHYTPASGESGTSE